MYRNPLWEGWPVETPKVKKHGGQATRHEIFKKRYFRVV